MTQINPILIQQLTEKQLEEIPESPTISWLPGKYARWINKHKGKFPYVENYFMITCKSCNRKGKYDVGRITVNIDNPNKTTDRTQTTGYFRCKHCNDAGNWEMPVDFQLATMTGLLVNATGEGDERSSIGKSLLYDGSWHKYCSDAEDYLLNKIKDEPHQSFIWNRLGNLYQSGGRPELAAAAFEHSIGIDVQQAESHYSLGNMFLEILEDDTSASQKAADHFKQLLFSANSYEKMPFIELREIVAHGLRSIMFLEEITNGEIMMLPSEEAFKEADKQEILNSILVELENRFIPNDIETFYPMAEIYMGSLSKRIPKNLRTWNKPNMTKKKKKRHKKKRK